MSLGEKTVIRGDSASFSIYFKDSAGDPIDITGWTVWFTVRKKKPGASIVNDDDADISKEITAQASFATGQAIVELSPEETDLDYGSYFYDVQYKKIDGTIKSADAGKYISQADITRST